MILDQSFLKKNATVSDFLKQEEWRGLSGGTLATLDWKFVSSGVDQYGDEPTDSLWGCNHTESALNELS